MADRHIKRQRSSAKRYSHLARQEYNTAGRSESARRSPYEPPKVEETPFRFRGVYTVPAYPPKRPQFVGLTGASPDQAARMVEALSQPGVDISLFKFMSDPGFRTAGQPAIESFQSFDPSHPFVTMDIEWLGTRGSDIFSPTEIALAHVKGHDIEVSAALVAPTPQQAERLSDLIKRAQSGVRLNADEWRTLRDLMLYSKSSQLGLPGAQISSAGYVISHAQWVRELRQGQDLRPFLRYAEEGLQELTRSGRTQSEVARWLSEHLSSAHARGEALLTWNGLEAEYPVIRDFFGVDSDVYRQLSRARHIDLLATTRSLVEDPVSQLLEPLAGRSLGPEDLRGLSGYLRQEELARLIGVTQQAHRAGSDVAALGRLAQRLSPILKNLVGQSGYPLASPFLEPGRQIFDPRGIRSGDVLYALRGTANAPYAVLTEGGEIIDGFVYRGTRSNVAYRVLGVRQFEDQGRQLFGVSLQPADQPNRTLYLGFETQDDLYRFFQTFAPVSEADPLIQQSIDFAYGEYARRRLHGFTDPRWSRAYGFAAASRFYEASARLDFLGIDPRELSDDKIRQVTGLRSEAEIRDFRQMHDRLRSEAGLSSSGEPTGVLRAIRAIRESVQDPIAQTQTFTAFMRRLNEELGDTWEGPMEEVALPMSRRVGVELDIEGLDRREITLTSRRSAVGQTHRILAEIAAQTNAEGERGKLWAMRERLLPALQTAEAITQDDLPRILRHSTAHQQAEELVGILASRSDQFRREMIRVPSLSARPDGAGAVLSNATLIDRLVGEAIEEAGRQTVKYLKQGDIAPLSGDHASFFRQLDQMIRAPFQGSIGSRFRSSQDVVTDLMRRLSNQGISSTLLLDPETGRMVLGLTTAEHANEVFSTIYRRGWKQRDNTHVAWVELPSVERGGLLTASRLSRPVADVVRSDSGFTPIIRSRFDYALQMTWHELRDIKKALQSGQARQAERIFQRGLNRRLERAVWSMGPWDHELAPEFVDSPNLRSISRLHTMELTEDAVRQIALEDDRVVELARQYRNVDLQRGSLRDLPHALRLAIIDAIHERVPQMFGVQTQISAVKAEHLNKYMVGLATGDVRELYPWGHSLNIGRPAPLQALDMIPLTESSVSAVQRGVYEGILPGGVITTLTRNRLEREYGIPLSSTTVKAALVGRQDILDAIQAAIDSGRITAEEAERIRSRAYFTTADEQIIISRRLAELHTAEELVEVRLAPDAEIDSRLVRAVNEKGEVIQDAQIVFTRQAELDKIARGAKIKKILDDTENTRAIFFGMRRDHKTGEIILRFQRQRAMTQGSRARIGTHKGVVTINDWLDKIFPGVDVLYYPSIERRGQFGEIAAGQIAKLAVHYSGTAGDRERFLQLLEQEAGVRGARWVESPRSSDQLRWQLALPTDEDLPLQQIEEFVSRYGRRLGIDITEQMGPQGPRVVTILGEFARLEQDENLLRYFRSDQVHGPGAGVRVGPRERQIFRIHGLDALERYAFEYGRLMEDYYRALGMDPRPVDPNQAYTAARAYRDRSLISRTISVDEFGDSLLPIKGLEGGYTPESIRGTIFDVETTGRNAFWLDLNLPEFTHATGRDARIAVVPEQLLVVGEERYLNTLNQKLRQILETAENIRGFHSLSPQELETIRQDEKLFIQRYGEKTIDDLYQRLNRQIDEYRRLVVGTLADYEGSAFMSGGGQVRLPGATLRMHVLDSVVDKIEQGTAHVHPEFFERMGIDPERPFAIVNRYPTDPSSIQVVRLVPSAHVEEPGQIFLPELTGRAQGGDTDSDTAVVTMIDSKTGRALRAERERIMREMAEGPERERTLAALDQLIKRADQLDDQYRREVVPLLQTVHKRELDTGRPIGIIDEDHLKSIADFGAYAQQDDFGRPLSPEERIRPFTSAGLGDQAGRVAMSVASEADRAALFQRQSAGLIGTVSMEIQRRINLAEYVWGRGSERVEKLKELHQLADVLDIIKEKSISAQKWDTGELPERLIRLYGDQVAIAIRETLKLGKLDDLEEILIALGRDAKTKRDLTREFVQERVGIFRELQAEAGAFWNHPWLSIGLKSSNLSEDDLIQRIGPMTPDAAHMFRAAGLSEEEIAQMERASREYLERQRAVRGTYTPPARAAIEETAEAVGARAMRALGHGAQISSGIMGAAIGMGIMAAGWLLPHALGGPRAELQRPDVVHAGVPENVRQLMVPEAVFPNVTPAATMPIMPGMNILVRAASPGDISGAEVAALMEQAVSSSVQLPLNVNATIRDERTVIDRSWVQRQVSRALG